VTALCWPSQRPSEVVFGTADGKIKLGMLKANKTYSMYAHPDGSYVVALAAVASGNAVASAHVDGSVFKFTFPEQEGQAPTYCKLLQHSCAPSALAWGDSLCAVGSDCKVRVCGRGTAETAACSERWRQHVCCPASCVS
jgi:intraflagellar transport protein 172